MSSPPIVEKEECRIVMSAFIILCVSNGSLFPLFTKLFILGQSIENSEILVTIWLAIFVIVPFHGNDVKKLPGFQIKGFGHADSGNCVIYILD